MSDYISREQAIKSIYGGANTVIYTREVVKTIDSLPSADVRENVHGEWIFYDEEFYPQCRFASAVNHRIRECSICHHKIADFNGEMRFCPNCGADMRKGET